MALQLMLLAKVGVGGVTDTGEQTKEGKTARAFQGEAEGLNHKSCSEKSSVNIFHLNSECI